MLKVLLVLSCLLPNAAAAETKAIWVTRFEWKTEAEIRTILRNCAAVGFNTVLFQVRGEADAYYRSEIEPWAQRLGGSDPGFDPLDVACKEARRLGLQLHAWINVMPGWRGKTPPADRTHITVKRPDWIVVDAKGRRQAWNDHYVCLNPMLPEVRAYVVSVVRDLASRYPVDGVHLDYVRLIEGDWSYDAKTLALFKAKTGSTPAKSPERWSAFRRDAVTDLVRSIRAALREERPRAELSAAVFPTASSRAQRFQDAEGWARQGLVDAVYPMIYEDAAGDFRELVDDAESRFRGVSVLPGVGAYRHDTPEQTIAQMRACSGGFAVFSYSSLWPSPDLTRREDAGLCRERREALRSWLNR